MRRAELVAAAAALLLSGCALLAPPADDAPLFRDPALTVQGARDTLAIGRSRKEEVAALLGPAETLRFDSGWEAWAWRARGERRSDAGAELVLLFDPDGVLRKSRAITGRAAPVPR